MQNLPKIVISIITLILALTLVACSRTQSNTMIPNVESTSVLNEGSDSTSIDNFISSQSEKQDQVASEYEATNSETSHSEELDEGSEQPGLVVKDYSDYQEYIESVKGFKPYYNICFEHSVYNNRAFHSENVVSMYQNLVAQFDYTAIRTVTLLYSGYYEGDTRFVDGYDFYIQYGETTGFPNPINTIIKSTNGKETLSTPLKALIMDQNILHNFDGSILEGRTFEESDYFISAQNPLIPVILGYAYKGIYKIGDTFTLTYLSSPVSLDVVGFFRENTSFSMGAGALEHVDLDFFIAMPFFIPMDESDESIDVENFKFHLGELLSGYIAIDEPISEINDNTHERYISAVEEIAAQYDLFNCITSPLWPVGFVFDDCTSSE